MTRARAGGAGGGISMRPALESTFFLIDIQINKIIYFFFAILYANQLGVSFIYLLYRIDYLK